MKKSRKSRKFIIAAVILNIAITAIMAAGCGGTGSNAGPAGNSGSNGAGAESNGSDAIAESNLKAAEVKYGDSIIALDDDVVPIIEELGDAKQYYEYPSCLFDGSDKTWDYGALQILTYPDGEKDYISSINILEAGVEINSGAQVGDSVSDLQNAYGDNIKQESSTIYRVEDKDYGIDFIVDGDTVKEIDIYLNQ